MAAILPVHPLLLNINFIETARSSSLRTAFLHVHFLFILYTVCVVGRGLRVIHEFGRMHAWETSKFLKENIFWLNYISGFGRQECSLDNARSVGLSLLYISMILYNDV